VILQLRQAPPEGDAKDQDMLQDIDTVKNMNVGVRATRMASSDAVTPNRRKSPNLFDIA